MTPALSIWTVGHSNHPFESFQRLLESQQIEVVVDVRSYPYSRFAPQFNRDQLAPALEATGTDYYFQGEALGGRPDEEGHYDSEGHALYGAMAKQQAFRDAIDRLLSGAAKRRIALLCSEGRPADCHRRLLVGRVLAGRGAELRHILPDGSIEVEGEVKLSSSSDQTNLFANAAPTWRSTQSVSHRRRRRISSAA